MVLSKNFNGGLFKILQELLKIYSGTNGFHDQPETVETLQPSTKFSVGIMLQSDPFKHSAEYIRY